MLELETDGDEEEFFSLIFNTSRYSVNFGARCLLSRLVLQQDDNVYQMQRTERIAMSQPIHCLLFVVLLRGLYFTSPRMGSKHKDFIGLAARSL